MLPRGAKGEKKVRYKQMLHIYPVDREVLNIHIIYMLAMTVLLNKKHLRQETLQDVPSIAFSGLCKDVIWLCFQGQNPLLGCT